MVWCQSVMERFERSDGGRDGLSDTRCLAVKSLELVVALVVASLALLDTTMAAPWQQYK